MYQSIAAIQYAKAAFKFSIENKAVEYWQSMLQLMSKVSCDHQIIQLLSNPILSKERLADIFISACHDRIDHYGQNLIRIMAENYRLSIFPSVLKEFIHLRMIWESILDIDVISAHCLSNEQLSNIGIAMENRFLRKVNINVKIDQSILGGLIIRIGDIVIDGSIRCRLEYLSKGIN